MYGLLYSAIFTGLTWFLKTVVIKFVLFAGLYFVVHEFIGFIGEKLPTFAGFDELFGGLPAGLWYFLDIMQFPSGFSMVLSAYLLRFMVRRVPFLG